LGKPDAAASPTNFLTVVDALRLDQEVNIALEIRVRIEVVWYVGAGKLFENFRAIRL